MANVAVLDESVSMVDASPLAIKKKISIVVPCYNEEENVTAMADTLVGLMETALSAYDYELIFIDNHSEDATPYLIKRLCEENPHIKAILNTRNFGGRRSPYYALLQATGDCAVLIYCDFQEPVDLIPEFVKAWDDDDYKIVCGVKLKSDENKLMRFIRNTYYNLLRKMSNHDIIDQFLGFGLYDRSFLDFLKELNDPLPFLRGLVAESGFRRLEIPYRQAKRRAGKSHYDFGALYDDAMLSFTSYTTAGLRMMTVSSFVVAILGLIFAIFYVVSKILWPALFPAGVIPSLIAIVVFGSMILFFIGLLGEYIIVINRRLMNRPIVVEEERINFDMGSDREARLRR